MKKKKVAIVGATGVVGRTVLKVLEEENFKNVNYLFIMATILYHFHIIVNWISCKNLL